MNITFRTAASFKIWGQLIGDKLLGILLPCPQNGSGVLKGLIPLHTYLEVKNLNKYIPYEIHDR